MQNNVYIKGMKKAQLDDYKLKAKAIIAFKENYDAPTINLAKMVLALITEIKSIKKRK